MAGEILTELRTIVTFRSAVRGKSVSQIGVCSTVHNVVINDTTGNVESTQVKTFQEIKSATESEVTVTEEQDSYETNNRRKVSFPITCEE
ncbi:hypothetical protein CDAR_548131 [Caerostris darwini]|uniref:Uncharacterized protein n=1 Tax=Caerostris darwini TaxID=1538125 RepID=A0AAV4WH94_9ARAC|nr:hypothetical protein CDAR_548131 [Caerostris darwini]